MSLQVKLSKCKCILTYFFIHQVKNISKKNLELEFCHAILANTIHCTISSGTFNFCIKEFIKCAYNECCCFQFTRTISLFARSRRRLSLSFFFCVCILDSFKCSSKCNLFLSSDTTADSTKLRSENSPEPVDGRIVNRMCTMHFMLVYFNMLSA